MFIFRLFQGAFTPGPLFQNLAHFPLSSVCLGICEHGNRARIRAKTIGPRSPERGTLGSIENKLWSGSVVVRKQSDPTDQAISQCMMGNYVSPMKNIRFVVLLIPQNEPVNVCGWARLRHSKSKWTFSFSNAVLLLFFVVGRVTIF